MSISNKYKVYKLNQLIAGYYENSISGRDASLRIPDII